MSDIKDYKQIVKPMLDKSEGFKDTLYYDSKNLPTIGPGLNLKDEGNVTLMKLNNIDVDSLFQGGQLTPEQGSLLRDKVLERKEKELRSHVSDDLFDELNPNEKASLMSLMYNSRNLIGPKLKENLAKGDKLGTAREILAYLNPKNELGTLVRRSDEASTFIGNDEEQLNNLFRTLTPEEIQKLKSVLDKSDNENVKREYLERFGKYINPTTQTLPLTKLFEK